LEKSTFFIIFHHFSSFFIIFHHFSSFFIIFPGEINEIPATMFVAPLNDTPPGVT